MSARGFGSVIWAGAVAGAALGFYLVSLNVASERAQLEQVENRIAMAQRDIRLLQTEIGTRGRLAQLERWNVKFIRLSAPTADQFVEGGFQLATMVAPHKKPVIEAPVVLASAPVDQAIAQRPQLTGDADGTQVSRRAPQAPGDMMHVAGYTLPETSAAAVKPTISRQPAPAAKTVASKAQSQAAATKLAKSAMGDPLAPLPTAKPKAKGGALTASVSGATSTKTLKDSDTD